MSNNISFISFEGADGTGKTTLINELFLELNKYYGNKKQFIKTREPGGSEIAEKIRSILNESEVHEKTEALLFAASRTEHYYSTIKPALDSNKIVLCDRFLESSLAYQGYFKEIGMENILSINRFGIGEFRPDLIFYLDTDIEEIKKRIQERGLMNWLDHRTIQKINEIKNCYEKVFENLPKDIELIRINANCEKKEILDEVFNIIITRLGK